VLLLPLYALAKMVPGFQAGADRLGLVTLDQMTHALISAIEQPPRAGSLRVVEVPEIRASTQARDKPAALVR
jgi:hypothetical protein